ncbi:MAG: PAS domain-containing sensor histidine kinase, partial [Nitrospinota bacterium]|nr:PAS domain-containing sensor histidine kinase [Nitrospinota bacterium]
MKKEELEKKIDELSRELSLLKEENEILTDQTEDVSLLGVVSERISFLEKESEVINVVLEDVVLGKDLVYASYFSIASGEVQIHEDFCNSCGKSLKDERIKLDKELEELLANGQHFGEISEGLPAPRIISALKVSPAVNSYYLFPMSPSLGPSGWFLFTNNFDDKAYLKKQRYLLNRIVELARVRIDVIRIHEQLNLEIAERQEAERNMNASEARYRLILNSSVEGIYKINLKGECTFANVACSSLLGYDAADQLIGKNMHNLIHHSHADGTPYQAEDCRIYQAFREKKSTNISNEVFWRADGSSFPVEYWSRPVQDENGVIGSVVSFVNITRRKEAEEKLFKSEKIKRTIIETAGQGFWMLDPDLKIVEVNHSLLEMLGYSYEEMIGKKPHDFADEENQKILAEQASRILVSDQRVYEVTLLTKNRENIYVIIHASTILDNQGKMANVFAFVMDITERKRIERKLIEAKTQAEEATKLKDKYVSLVAHDLKSPLATSLGLLEFIDRDSDNPLSPRQKELYERAAQTGQMMVKTIDEVLNISRLQTGAIEVRKRFITANRIIYHVLGSTSFLAEKKGIEITNEIPEATYLYADYDLFSNVIQNLVSNAIKFCNKGDEIRLSITTGETVTFAVEDTGIGVRPGILEKLFRHEEKTSTLGTAGERGTGLGLPYSQDIIKAHGGAISVT